MSLGHLSEKSRIQNQKPLGCTVQKKRVSEKTCDKTENKNFFEAYLLTIGGEKDDVTCRVLRRTIVSTAENISPFQEEGVLPFTLENDSCGEWLESNREF